MARLAKTLRDSVRHMRDSCRGLRQRPVASDVTARGSVLLIGPPEFRPAPRLLTDAQPTGPPMPLDAVRAWPTPPDGQADDVILAAESLKAASADAVDRILSIMAHARRRVIVAPGTADASCLDAVEAALRARRSGRVASVTRIAPDGGDPGALVAAKRRIGELILVAGPSAAGKSSFMKHLASARPHRVNAPTGYAHAAAAVAERLQIAPGRHWWPPAYAKHLHEVSTASLDRLLLQYDFTRPAKRAWARGERDPVLDVVDTAAWSSAITIWTPPDRLREQARHRAGAAASSKLQNYADPDRVRWMYRTFAEAIEGGVDQHCVIEIDTQTRFADPRDWHRFIAGAGA